MKCESTLAKLGGCHDSNTFPAAFWPNKVIVQFILKGYVPLVDSDPHCITFSQNCYLDVLPKREVNWPILACLCIEVIGFGHSKP
jgi:hypothetical protein